MQATSILIQEHRVIEQVLECLVRIVLRFQKDGTLNLKDAGEAVHFFRGFADRCHHGKEETYLFPMMESKGIPREGGPLGVMLHEHESGRAHIRAMREALDAAEGGSQEALGRFIENAQAYSRLLRDHIQKEDQCLFPMAEQVIGPKDEAALLDLFEHVEHEEMGEGTHENFLKIAADLATAYKVPQAGLAPAKGGCGCAHQARK
jgi:hemerythrin-like domain-containing protein